MRPKTHNRIALAGKARSGKSTGAEHLAKTFKYARVSFAKPLYDVLHYAQRRFGFKKEKNREFLQFLGSWARKYAIANKLPDPVLTIAKKTIDKHEKVVIDDLRMKIEKDFLEKEGFKIYRIVGREVDDIGFGGSKNHITENDLNDCQLEEIANDGTVEDYEKKLDSVVIELN